MNNRRHLSGVQLRMIGQLITQNHQKIYREIQKGHENPNYGKGV